MGELILRTPALNFSVSHGRLAPEHFVASIWVTLNGAAKVVMTLSDITALHTGEDTPHGVEKTSTVQTKYTESTRKFECVS